VTGSEQTEILNKYVGIQTIIPSIKVYGKWKYFQTYKQYILYKKLGMYTKDLTVLFCMGQG